MSKAYFTTITTTGLYPSFEATASKHNQKLQNYLKYGITLDDEAMGPLKPELKPVALGGQRVSVEREVEHMAGGVTVDQNGQRYCFWTTLCCEEEESK